VADQFEAVVVQKAIDIAARSGEIIIDANDAGTLFEQSLAAMGAKKSDPASYQYPSFEMHVR
jgi:hypothetical protein